MNQKVLIRIIRLSRGILISYIQRAYARLKRMIWGRKLEQEKKDAERAIASAEESAAAAEYYADKFQREYARYKRKRAINSLRVASSQMLGSGGKAERDDRESKNSIGKAGQSDRDPRKNN